MQKKQSTIRKANTIGILFIYLKELICFMLEERVLLVLTSLETKVEMPQTAEHQQVGSGRG
jgi:hypothetical protein